MRTSSGGMCGKGTCSCRCISATDTSWCFMGAVVGVRRPKPSPLSQRASVECECAVIVAVVAVRMVQMAGREIVDVIAVRDRLVPTRGAVMVIRRVAVVIARRASHGVLRAHADRVLRDSPAVLVLEVAMRQVVDMALVVDRPMSTRGVMHVLLAWRRHRYRCSGEMPTPVACAPRPASRVR